MGLRKALGALTKKGFNTSKLKSTAALAVSRTAVLKNQRQARVNVSRSDVVHLLKMGNQDTALIRVEQVIRQKNILDALVVLEGYCNLVLESVNLVAQEKSCPDELKEAFSTLIFASARMGDFPELLEIRSIFSDWYGKEFVSRAVELRNNSGVNPRVVQMLSARMPSLESRKIMLKKIADEENIELSIEPAPYMENQKVKQEQEIGNEKKTGRTYKDVADAAQEAFESAAYAAAAARAALELSRGGNDKPGFDGHPKMTKGIHDIGAATRNVVYDEEKKVEGSSNKNEVSEGVNINRRPSSVRTRRFQGS